MGDPSSTEVVIVAAAALALFVWGDRRERRTRRAQGLTGGIFGFQTFRDSPRALPSTAWIGLASLGIGGLSAATQNWLPAIGFLTIAAVASWGFAHIWRYRRSR